MRRHTNRHTTAMGLAAGAAVLLSLLVIADFAGWKGAASRTLSRVAAAGFTPTALRSGFAPDALARDPGASGHADATLRLRDADATDAGQPREVVDAGTPLDPARIDALLGRLPDLIDKPAERSPFEVRPGTRPPPLTGDVVELPFPPPVVKPTPTVVPGGPLRVTRHAPVGPIAMAAVLSITFSEPMVALGSTLDATLPPSVELTPQPTGRWRWLGTQTLVFEPTRRFPAATTYRVRVPAGMRATSGNALEEDLVFAFETPPVELVSSSPNGSAVGLQPVLFMQFDQRIDPKAVLDFVRLEGRKTEKLRLATPAEIEADAAAQSLSQRAEPDRWIALTPKSRLEPGQKYEVVLREGVPSAEGPRKTEGVQQFAFSTFDALAIEDHACRTDSPCRPSGHWWVRFNNPLDEAQALELEIEPKLPQPRVEVRDRILSISGSMQAKTAYRIVVPASLRDRFGQSLGQDAVIELTTGPASRQLYGRNGVLVTIDPFGPAVLPLYSTNNRELAIDVRRVQPEDWHAFDTWRETRARPDAFAGGESVLDSWLKVDDEDRTKQFDIDLRPYLENDSGHFVVWVETADRIAARKLLQREASQDEARRKLGDPRRWPRLPGSELVYWVQVTRLGLTALTDGRELVGWVTSLRDGSPVAGATVSIDPPVAKAATSNASGIAGLVLEKRSESDPVIVARHEDDAVILADYGLRDRDPAHEARTLLWYPFTDRGVYRPGESVHLKGWLRSSDDRLRSELTAPVDRIERVDWTLQGPRGETIAEGRAPLTALAGFDFVAEIPLDSGLGGATFVLTAVGSKGRVEASRAYHPIQLQEFRRPEFEVSTEFDASEHLLGDTAFVRVDARYFEGGGLSMAPVTWEVLARDATYTPPHHDAFTFGPWIPWWGGIPFREPRATRFQHTATSDAQGRHRLAIDLVSVATPRPFVVDAQASVQDRNRQRWSSRSQTLVHPAAQYVGLKAERSFVQAGEAFAIESVVVDIAGQRVSGVDVELRVEEAESFFQRGSRAEDASTTPVARCATTSTAEPSACRFEIERGGGYRVIASIRDEQGRRNESELRFWVAGGRSPIARNVDREHVQLIPDRKTYQPGDTAEILVQAPFAPAEGLLVLGHDGIVETETFRLEEATHTLRVPIRETHLAGLNVAVELVGRSDDDAASAQDGRPRVAFAGGDIQLDVPPRSRGLHVSATPQHEALSPGAETRIALHVEDATGRAVSGAEVAVAVVDEAVLALTGYTLRDPLDAFYPDARAGYTFHHQRSQVALTALSASDSSDVAPDFAMRPFETESRMALGAAPNASSEASAPIDLRADFSALALFVPAVVTDADGGATVSLKLPDSITRYRIMAVAVAGERFFGKGESQIVARLPLVVRPSPPRFLNFGDRVELPVLIQNQTDEALDVEVAIRASNATFEVAGLDSASTGSALRVPPNDRVEVRFTATSTQPGTARFQVATASGAHSDAAQFAFPVWTPATTEATAAYGVIDDGAAVQPVRVPREVWPQIGGLEITASSTQLQALTDAMLYLNHYAFECSEQIASRVLAVVALQDVLAAFEVQGMPAPSELTARVRRDIETLSSIQNTDGGFGFWRAGERSWPFLTIHVAHAITLAREKDLAPEFPGWRGLETYLANLDRHIEPDTSVRTANALRAYALYVRHLNGDFDRKRARALALEEDLSIESLGWLLPLLVSSPSNGDFDAALRRVQNQVTESAASAHFVTHYTDGDHVLLHSDRRADGVVLGALVETDAQNDLIPKLVRSLLDHRKRGRWSNTQENVFILLALARTFERLEAETPDFTARFWLDEGYAGEHVFEGRSTDRVRLDVPMSRWLETEDTVPLVLQKSGAGRLYYRVGTRYAPKSLQSDALDSGFTVTREYEAVDDPNDVGRDEDGTIRIKAGARVRVSVTMVNPMRRSHVALVDPLPAGLEPINSALATSESLPRDDEAGSGWWYGHWYEHENLRDERAEAFASLLREGVHTYRYFARATTPGEFVVPPARVEEMYHPETFGRSSSLRVVVE